MTHAVSHSSFVMTALYDWSDGHTLNLWEKRVCIAGNLIEIKRLFPTDSPKLMVF